MSMQTKARPTGASVEPGHGTAHTKLTANSTTRTPPRSFWTKRRRVLLYLSRGHSLNCFEAVPRLHDYVLRSTVSAIQADGIEVFRTYETVRGFMGTPVTCSRYRLLDPERIKAKHRLASEMCGAGVAGSVEAALPLLEAEEHA